MTMSSPDSHHDNDSEFQLPQALVSDLRSALTGKVDVPSKVDAHVWAAARQTWLRQRRRRFVIRTLQATAACAAAVMLVVWISWPGGNPLATPPVASPTRMADATLTPFDGTRRVDILDAFTLAKQLDRRTPPDASWDLNNDGTVDRRDVDIIAFRAVSLEGSTIQ